MTFETSGRSGLLRAWLGIDIACRAAHQASLADERGQFVWSGRRFRTIAEDLERLWEMIHAGTDPPAVTVIMEPTRNAWVPLAAWFRRRGGSRVVMVPPELNGGNNRAGNFVRSTRAFVSRHQRIRAYTPAHNGKAERYQRTLAEELLYARVWTSETERANAIQIWNIHYN